VNSEEQKRADSLVVGYLLNKLRPLLLVIPMSALCAFALGISSAVATQDKTSRPKPGIDVVRFDPSAEKVAISFANGDSRTYKAGNRTTNPSGDPCTVGSHAPAPPGEWSLNLPHYAYPGDDRYPRVGAAFFLIGSPGTAPFRRDVGLHAGSSSYTDLTFGCIRISNADMDNLLAYLKSAKRVLQGMSIPGKALCSPQLETGPAKAPQSQPLDFFDKTVEQQAHAAGVNYFKELRETEGGDAAQLADVFKVTPYMDGAAAEFHAQNLYSLLKRFGDQAFSAALATQSQTVRDQVVQSLDYAFSTGQPAVEKQRNWDSAFPLTFRQATHSR
jgi:hypothetical protein